MAWDIEKVSENVKKNPIFIIGAGVVVVAAFFLLARKKGTEGQQTYYAEMPVTTDQVGGAAGGDLSQFAANILMGFSEISAAQTEQFMAGLKDIQTGQIALYGSMQDSIISMQKEQTSLFSSMQESFEDTIEKLITSQQRALSETSTNKYYYPTSGGGGSSSSTSKSSSSSDDNKVGYAYIDKYGFSHVVSSRETAEQYAAPGTTISEYGGSFSGGYARDEQGERLSLGGIPYGN